MSSKRIIRRALAVLALATVIAVMQADIARRSRHRRARISRFRTSLELAREHSSDRQ